MVARAHLPGGRALPRKAGALGVALALHGLLAVAWGEGLAGRVSAGHEGAGAAAPTTVAWLKLLPAEAPAAVPAAALVAAPAPLDTPEPAQPAASASPTALGEPVDGQLVQQGGPWSPGYPDADLGAARVVLLLSLQLDAAHRVRSAQAATAAARPELVQYILEQLEGAVLEGHPAAPGEPVCLEVSFEAADARVSWRFVAASPRAGCAGPRRG